MLCEATPEMSSSFLLVVVFVFLAGRRHERALSLRVEGEMALNATTSLQNKLDLATY